MTDTEIRNAIADYCGGIAYQKYESDLNAMHEAEKILLPDQEISYYVELQVLCRPTGMKVTPGFIVIHAGARQRAEAFLRTLNKWKEE